MAQCTLCEGKRRYLVECVACYGRGTAPGRCRPDGTDYLAPTSDGETAVKAFEGTPERRPLWRRLLG